jgi:protein ImuB
MFACIDIPDFPATAQAALLDLAFAFSPRVEDVAPGVVVIDLAGLSHLWGSPQAMANHLAQRVSALGFQAHVAIAPHPEAARWAARGLAGITLIGPGEEAERLGPLPVSVLDPPPELLETFERWGVRTLRDLAALPEAALAERLGQAGVRLQKLARGAALRPLVPAQLAPHFAETMELEYPVSLLEPLLFMLNQLLSRLCARLALHGLAASELHLQMAFEPGAGKEQARTLRLAVPLRDPQVLLKLLQLHLQSAPPPAPIRKVTLTAEPAEPRPAQAGLFLPPAPNPEKLEVVLARLARLVGPENVGSPELMDSYRPDAFRMVAFHPLPPGPTPSRRRRESQDKVRRPNPGFRPLRLFRPPLAAAVRVSGGRPAYVQAADGIRGKVIRAVGPWRTSGEWWTQNGWDQDEWDVRVVRGSFREASNLSTILAQIYQDRRTGSWFVRGIYD